MDNFNTLTQRLQSRCPSAGLFLSRQLINDNWHKLQSRREWSWRRRHGTFAPPNIYAVGQVSTNVGIGQPTLVTGIGTTWTPQMVGTQIRLGGLMYPYYTIVQYISPTALMLDQPWAGPEQVNQPYQILQLYFPVPSDFGYWYVVVSTKDGYRLWTDKTEGDLAIYDPQRTNTGQTYAVAFLDYSPIYGGTISQPIAVAATGATPISTTTSGYTYVANATYIIQVLTGGVTGTATYQWMRTGGQTAFTGPVATTDYPIDLMDGVQLYWPDLQTYVANDLFVVNAQSLIQTGVPRYELWPAPTYAGYLYPYIYIAKEYDLTDQQPTLPPFIANRGEVLLEMALSDCARWPGTAAEPNPYFNLALAQMHEGRAEKMLWDLERNDEEIGVTLVDYQMWPMAMAPWLDGNWQQTHAPFLVG